MAEKNNVTNLMDQQQVANQDSLKFLDQKMQNSIRYCRDQAKKYSKRDKALSITKILVTATITVLGGMVAGGQEGLIHIISLLAAVATVLQGISTTVNYKEKELFYSQAYGNLSTEHLLFVTKSEPYDSPDMQANLRMFAKKVADEVENYLEDTN